MAVVRITHVSPPAPTNYGQLSLSPSPSLSLVCISAAQPLKEQDEPLAPHSSIAAEHTRTYKHTSISMQGRGYVPRERTREHNYAVYRSAGVGPKSSFTIPEREQGACACSRPEAQSKIKRRTARRPPTPPMEAAGEGPQSGAKKSYHVKILP